MKRPKNLQSIDIDLFRIKTRIMNGMTSKKEWNGMD